MEIYLQIEKVYFKHHFYIHVMIAFLLCFLSPFVIGVENLDKYQTAKVLEMFFSLMGIILLIPVFLPDFDLSIRELLESKKVPLWLLRVLRLLQSIFILLILLFICLCPHITTIIARSYTLINCSIFNHCARRI